MLKLFLNILFASIRTLFTSSRLPLSLCLWANKCRFRVFILRCVSLSPIKFEVRHPCSVGSITKKKKNYITHTVEHNYISPSSTVSIQLHVSALYVGHLQVVI